MTALATVGNNMPASAPPADAKGVSSVAFSAANKNPVIINGTVNTSGSKRIFSSMQASRAQIHSITRKAKEYPK